MHFHFVAGQNACWVIREGSARLIQKQDRSDLPPQPCPSVPHRCMSTATSQLCHALSNARPITCVALISLLGIFSEAPTNLFAPGSEIARAVQVGGTSRTATRYLKSTNMDPAIPVIAITYVGDILQRMGTKPVPPRRDNGERPDWLWTLILKPRARFRRIP